MNPTAGPGAAAAGRPVSRPISIARLSRRARVRTLSAVFIILAWLAGAGMLAKRELFIGQAQQMADAALRLSPGATYFVVEQGGKQLGFASTTIDTSATGIDVVDYFIADVPVAGRVQRASARSVVKLSRALALRTFDVLVESPQATLRAGGRAEGDTAVVYALSAGREKPDSQRIAVRGPILLPTLVPLAVALGETPKVGRKYSIPTFDPNTMTQRATTLEIRAESLFRVVDSARFDQERAEWVSALVDTVRAWQVEPTGPGGGFTGWVDAQGRVVEATQPGGLKLRRMAYEIAFENWRIARNRASAAAADSSDILEQTAIAANAPVGRSRLAAMSVRLLGVDLRGYDLAGGRQTFTGDTLRVRREADSALAPSWSLVETPGMVPREQFRARFRAELAAEPLLQANDLRIVDKAVRIAGLDRNPRVIAEKLNRWVYDSLQKVVTFSVPNALEILRTRKGDCNEHTQLYVALARALGIPTRIATGLAFVRGKFYYHAWPEVYLGDWVAVDPTFGQFPADAAHLRFVTGGLARQAELLRLIGNLRIRVLEVR